MAEADDAAKGMLRQFRAVPAGVKWLIYLSTPSTISYGYLIIAISAYFPEIGFSSGDIGILLGANGLSFAISAIPIGILADRRGKKTIFLLGLFSIPPLIFVYAMTVDMLILTIASVVAGVSEGAFMATWNALIADQTALTTRSAAFSLSFIVGNAGFGIGMAVPSVFPIVESWTGYTSEDVHTLAFVAMSLLALSSPLALVPVLRGFREEIHPPETMPTDERREGRKLLYKFSAINSLIGLGAGFIIPLIPTWLYLKFGVTDELSGPLLTVSNVTIALAALVSPTLGNKYGLVRAIVLTQSLSTVFMLSLAFVPDAALAATLYLIRAALMNMASPLADTFLMGIIPKEERGFASALNAIVWRLPNSASTIVGGAILAADLYDVPFYLATGFYLVSIWLFFTVFRDVKPKG